MSPRTTLDGVQESDIGTDIKIINKQTIKIHTKNNYKNKYINPNPSFKITTI